MLAIGAILKLAISIGLIGLSSIGVDHLSDISNKKLGKKKRDKDIEEEVVS